MRADDDRGDDVPSGDGETDGMRASRRAVLSSTCTGAALFGLSRTGLSAGADTGRSAAASGTVTLDDQTVRDRTVVATRIETDVRVSLLLSATDDDTIYARGELDPGTYDNYKLQLMERLTERREVELFLYSRAVDRVIASDTAVLTPPEGTTFVDGLDLRLIEADPEAGFEYPYLLYAPAVETGEGKPPLVQPNNSGRSTDEFAVHREAAREEAETGLARRTADRLSAPLVVPALPRPREEPVDNTTYVQGLDRQTLEIDDGPLERVDRQLLAMAADARTRLRDADYPVGEGLLLNGFSASGTFVERFAALHPEEVVSVTAGGVNGMPLLPLEEAVGRTLNYHVGVADVESLTGEPFDREAFADVPRFLYMGEFDDSDTLPFDDAFTLDRLRETAFEVYGPHMTDDRFPYSRAVYDAVSANAVFREYTGEAHSFRPAVGDVVRYHARVLDGDDTATLRAALGGRTPNQRVHVVIRPYQPVVGERVAFDASGSTADGASPTAYEWAFGDGTTVTGRTAARTFEEPGTYPVTLRTTYADATYEATEYVEVVQAPSNEPADILTAADSGSPTATPDDPPARTADTATDGAPGRTGDTATGASGPGFGVGAASTALAGAAALLRLLRDDEQE